jgi:hypothetical protein
MADQKWVDGLITVLESAVANKKPIEFTGKLGTKITVEVKQELVDFLRENQSKLIRVGRRAFREFLMLWYEQKEFDALCVIYEQLDNSELIAKYQEDTVKLAEIAKQTQEDRDFWLTFGKQVGMRVVMGALGALI